MSVINYKTSVATPWQQAFFRDGDIKLPAGEIPTRERYESVQSSITFYFFFCAREWVFSMKVVGFRMFSVLPHHCSGIAASRGHCCLLASVGSK